MPEGGEAYAQALLTVLCSPPYMYVKLTTYRRIWTPEEIFQNPKRLEGQLALVVCVDAEKTDNRWWLKGLYPVREVIIRKSEIEGDYLALWVETQGYVRCDNYQTYMTSLRETLHVLPPEEKSYIASDSLRGLRVVPPEDESSSVTTWQSLVEKLVNIRAFNKAAFCLAMGVKTEKGKRLSPEAICVPEPMKAYRITKGSKYVAVLSHLLPLYNRREGLGRFDFEVDCPSWIHVDRKQFSIFGRQSSFNILIRPLLNAVGRHTFIEIRPKNFGFKTGIAPYLMFPIELQSSKKDWILRRLVPWVLVFFMLSLYAYGQLAQATKTYPSLDILTKISPELIGALFSSLALIIIPILVSMLTRRSS